MEIYCVKYGEIYDGYTNSLDCQKWFTTRKKAKYFHKILETSESDDIDYLGSVLCYEIELTKKNIVKFLNNL